MQAKASSSFQDHLGWDFTSVWGRRDSGEVKGNQFCQTHSKTSLVAASNKSFVSWLSSHIRDPPRQIKVFCESSHIRTFGLFVSFHLFSFFFLWNCFLSLNTSHSHSSSLSFSVYEAVHAAGMHFSLQWQQKGSALIKALPSAHVELVLKVSDETEVRHPATLSYGPSSPLIWEASHPSLFPLSHFILQYLAVFIFQEPTASLDVIEHWVRCIWIMNKETTHGN